jgi:tetratricopeptide (TPR) repeat protein
MSTSYPQKVAVRFGGFELDHSGEYSRKALEIDPKFPPAHMSLAWAYEGMEMFEQAIAEQERARELSGDQPIFIFGLGPRPFKAVSQDSYGGLLELR